MLTRKGTLGRRSRASIRRGRGTWGGPGGGTSGASAISRASGGSVKGARPGAGGYGSTGDRESAAGTRTGGAKRRSLIQQQQTAGEGCQGQSPGESYRLRAGVTSPALSVSSLSSSRDDVERGREAVEDGISNNYHHPVKGVSFADTVALAGEEKLKNRRFSGYSPSSSNKSNFSRNCSSLYNKRGRNSSCEIDKRVSGSCSALMFGLADQYSEFTATGRLSTSASGAFSALDNMRQCQSKVGNSNQFVREFRYILC
ncbi:hypothetical protein ElyMa_001356400 [Elysia marginata]|uniref:Uncharacterized protein n=1 Tax=Elysia marginata TaxID=1093978 RepID=A0AAV4INR6_9GAST|nr:hypothetical protein ElyMa_001356400 [Elysia marginata]